MKYGTSLLEEPKTIDRIDTKYFGDSTKVLRAIGKEQLRKCGPRGEVKSGKERNKTPQEYYLG